MPSPFNIVTLNVTVTQAPTPNTLQQTGAMISQGGTTNVVGSLTPLPTLAALTAMQPAAKNISTITWATGVVTVTTSAPHGWTLSDVIPVTISGIIPAGYNGTFNATITSTTQFTYPLASNPGVETQLGTVQLGAVSELQAMANTFFAGLQQQAPYILELGEGTAVEGIAALTTWLNNNPLTVYSWLVPREWDNVTQFLTLANSYVAPNKMTYFFVTTKTSEVTVGPPATSPYSAQTLKSVYAAVEAPAVVPSSEFSIASPWASSLAIRPSSSQRGANLAYVPAFGVTPYPTQGNSALLNELGQASVGWIGTGAAGGLSNTIVFQGYLSDGNQWQFWYSSDWAQINISQALANEIINGAPNGPNPLQYNQQGIDRLQLRTLQVLNTAVASGLAQSTNPPILTKLPTTQFAQNINAGLYADQIVVNAEPFLTHVTLNPSNYRQGLYSGLSCLYIPQLNFINLVFNLQVTNILVP